MVLSGNFRFDGLLASRHFGLNHCARRRKMARTRLVLILIFIQGALLTAAGAKGVSAFSGNPVKEVFRSEDITQPDSPPPPNDLRQNPYFIYSEPYVIAADVSGATTSWDDPYLSCAGQGSHSVWFQIRPTVFVPHEISTAGSSYDTVVAVFASERGNLTEVACNDDYEGSLQAYVQWTPSWEPDYYLIEVTSYGASPAGFLSMTVNSLVPGNDDCSNAWLVTALPFVLIQQTAYAATGEFDPELPCGSPGNRKGSHSVWYRYTATRNAIYEADTHNSGYDTVLAVMQGGCGSMQILDCNDDDQSLQSRVQWRGYEGQTYYLEITSYGSSPGGELHLKVNYAPPENDACLNATPLMGDFSQIMQTTYGATLDTAEPMPACAGLYNTVWFSYNRPESGEVIFSTAGTSFDTVVGVYTGTCAGNLVRVACNDDAIGSVYGSRYSALAFHAIGGVNYLIQVGGYSDSDAGDLIVSLCAGPPCQPVSAVKSLPLNSRVSVCDAVITGYFAGFPEVQQLDGASGIHLSVSSQELLPGTLVHVIGNLVWSSPGNLYLSEGDYVGVGFTGMPKPVGILSRDVGGSDFFLQKGAPGGTGPNNVSLLVRVWGRVTSVDAANRYYWVDDGCGLMQGDKSRKGILIWSAAGPLPAVNEFVEVTGTPWIWNPGAQAIIRQLRPYTILNGNPQNPALTFETPGFPEGMDPATGGN